MCEKIIVASSNQGKIREIKQFFADLPLEIMGPPQAENLSEVIEDGATFAENALKKARTRAQELNEIIMADDSGLVVDYLNGAPGIYSARYAGSNATDQENYQKLLKKLEDVPTEEKTAAFVSVIAVVDPFSEEELTVQGICPGMIIDQPRGNNGFGYDPVFFLPEKNKTMAELSADEKNQISHRAKALEKLKGILLGRYSE